MKQSDVSYLLLEDTDEVVVQNRIESYMNGNEGHYSQVKNDDYYKKSNDIAM